MDFISLLRVLFSLAYHWVPRPLYSFRLILSMHPMRRVHDWIFISFQNISFIFAVGLHLSKVLPRQRHLIFSFFNFHLHFQFLCRSELSFPSLRLLVFLGYQHPLYLVRYFTKMKSDQNGPKIISIERSRDTWSILCGWVAHIFTWSFVFVSQSWGSLIFFAIFLRGSQNGLSSGAQESHFQMSVWHVW